MLADKKSRSETREHIFSSQNHSWLSWLQRASVRHVWFPLHFNLPVFTKCYIAKQDVRGLLQNHREGVRREELQNILSRGKGLQCLLSRMWQFAAWYDIHVPTYIPLHLSLIFFYQESYQQLPWDSQNHLQSDFYFGSIEVLLTK